MLANVPPLLAAAVPLSILLPDATRRRFLAELAAYEAVKVAGDATEAVGHVDDACAVLPPPRGVCCNDRAAAANAAAVAVATVTLAARRPGGAAMAVAEVAALLHGKVAAAPTDCNA